MLKAAIRLLTARIKGSNIVDLRTIPVCINNEIFPFVAGNFPVLSVVVRLMAMHAMPVKDHYMEITIGVVVAHFKIM